MSYIHSVYIYIILYVIYILHVVHVVSRLFDLVYPFVYILSVNLQTSYLETYWKMTIQLTGK